MIQKHFQFEALRLCPGLYASDQDTFNGLHAFAKIEIILYKFILS